MEKIKDDALLFPPVADAFESLASHALGSYLDYQWLQ